MEAIDLSASAGGRTRAMEEWRDGSSAAQKGWEEAGIALRKTPEMKPAGKAQQYVEGMIVRHDKYGTGKVAEPLLPRVEAPARAISPPVQRLELRAASESHLS